MGLVKNGAARRQPLADAEQEQFPHIHAAPGRPLAPHPWLQLRLCLINLMPVQLIARPSQYPRPPVASHRPENSRNWLSSTNHHNLADLQILPQSHVYRHNSAGKTAGCRCSP